MTESSNGRPPRVSDGATLEQVDIAAPTGGLSARQRQILELLRAGKVNKEIANELGIGLGTVKQHVVALFKKLNVRNRTMAVSVTAGQPDTPAESRLDDGLLEKRPCAVLGFALAPDALAETARLAHRTMAEYAFDLGAIYLSRQEAGGDLIMGISQASETAHVHAAHAVASIVRALDAAGVDTRQELKCGIAVGLAIASMRRTGGWSGEALVSATIAQARALADRSAPGHVLLGDEARALFASLGPASCEHLASSLPFAALDHVPWRIGEDVAEESEPVGREEELSELAQSIKRAARGGAGMRIHIEAETGMGKSSLCRAAIRLVIRLGGEWRYLFCQAVGGAYVAHDLADGRPVPVADLPGMLKARSGKTPTLCVIDDAHLLPTDIVAEILRSPLAEGQILLLTGRRHPATAESFGKSFHLGRLSNDACREIAHRVQPRLDDKQVQEIAEQSAGVPLFASEMAKSGGPVLPLSLRFVIAGRMDRLGLDRLLLRCVARHPGFWSVPQLVAGMDGQRERTAQALQQAVATGVMKRDEQERFHFSHPLLRQAVLQAEVDRL